MAAVISPGVPVGSSSARNRSSIRNMKKLPPTNVCRASPLRGDPSTDEIGVSSSTTGI
jgi:hypothetical protein